MFYNSKIVESLDDKAKHAFLNVPTILDNNNCYRKRLNKTIKTIKIESM